MFPWDVLANTMTLQHRDSFQWLDQKNNSSFSACLTFNSTELSRSRGGNILPAHQYLTEAICQIPLTSHTPGMPGTPWIGCIAELPPIWETSNVFSQLLYIGGNILHTLPGQIN